MQPLKKKRKIEKIETPIFFDIETWQDIEVEQNKYGPVYLHRLCCCIAQKVCDPCKGKPFPPNCSHCGGAEYRDRGLGGRAPNY